MTISSNFTRFPESNENYIRRKIRSLRSDAAWWADQGNFTEARKLDSLADDIAQILLLSAPRSPDRDSTQAELFPNEDLGLKGHQDEKDGK